jgi:hypothetical protein
MRAEGWIEHDGGECPVNENITVYVMMRNGTKGWAMRYANAWEWNGTCTDFVAYRIEGKQP